MSEPVNPLPWNTELSPFHSVIGTNHIPTTAELKSLQVLLVHPLHQLSLLESEIESVQTLLNSLISRKRKIQDYIEAHEALASPVRRIPPEALAEIFVQCLPAEPSYPVRDLTEAPLLLTTICRHWRSVAITTPRLWHSLHIFVPPHLSTDACSRRVAGVKLWLERSGSLPLSISLQGNLRAGFSQQNLELMIRSLAPFSNRLGDVVFRLPPQSFTALSEYSPSLFPTLVSLRVGNGPNVSYRGLPVASNGALALVPLLPRMPFLKKLHIEHLSSNLRDSDYHTLPCHWENLTNLVIEDGLSPSKLRTILAETPRMRCVSLTISIGEDAIFQTSMVHLNDLSEMYLTVWIDRTPLQNMLHTPDTVIDRNKIIQNEISSFVGCIQCSALRLLSFVANYPQLKISQWPFTGLPLHALETLELSAPITPDALMECLSQTQNLITFCFATLWREFPLLDSHLSSLISSPNNPTPSWPRLQNIQMRESRVTRNSYSLQPTFQQEGSSITSFTNAGLIKFLESRSRTTLRSCEISYHPGVEPSFSEAELKALERLKRNGLNLRLTYTKPRAVPHVAQESDLPRNGLTPAPHGLRLDSHMMEILELP